MHRVLILATVTDVYNKSISYPSCDQCYSKLLIDPTTARYHCLRCVSSLVAGEISWRYRLALTVSDGSAICRVAVFGRTLDVMFGKNATDFNRSLVQLEKSGYPSDQMLAEALRRTFKGKYFYFGFKTARSHPTDASPSLADIAAEVRTQGCDQMNESSDYEQPCPVAYQIIAGSEGVYATVTDHMRLLVKRLKSGNSMNKMQSQKQSDIRVEDKHCSFKDHRDSNLSSSCHTMSFGSGQKSVKFSFENSLPLDCSRENYLSEPNTTSNNSLTGKLRLVENLHTQNTDSSHSNEHREAVTLNLTDDRLEESYLEQTDLDTMELSREREILSYENDSMTSPWPVPVPTLSQLPVPQCLDFSSDVPVPTLSQLPVTQCLDFSSDVPVPTLSQLPVTQCLDFSSDAESELSTTCRKIDRELKRRERLRSSQRVGAQKSHLTHTLSNISMVTSASHIAPHTNSVVNYSYACNKEHLKCLQTTCSKPDESVSLMQGHITQRKCRTTEDKFTQEREMLKTESKIGNVCSDYNTTLFVENFDNMPESEPLEAFLDSFDDFTIDSGTDSVAEHEGINDAGKIEPSEVTNKLESLLDDTRKNEDFIEVRNRESENDLIHEKHDNLPAERMANINSDNYSPHSEYGLCCESEITDKSRATEDFDGFDDSFSRSCNLLTNQPSCERKTECVDISYCLLSNQRVDTESVNTQYIDTDIKNVFSEDFSSFSKKDLMEHKEKHVNNYSDSDRNVTSATGRPRVNDLVVEMPESENLDKFLDSFEEWSLCIENEYETNSKENSSTLSNIKHVSLIRELEEKCSVNIKKNEHMKDSHNRDDSKHYSTTCKVTAEDGLISDTSEKQSVYKTSVCSQTDTSSTSVLWDDNKRPVDIDDLKFRDVDESSDLEELESFLDKVSLDQGKGQDKVADSGCNELCGDTACLVKLETMSSHLESIPLDSNESRDKGMVQLKVIKTSDTDISFKNNGKMNEEMDENKQCYFQQFNHSLTEDCEGSKPGFIHSVKTMISNETRVLHENDSVDDRLDSSELDTDLDQFMNDICTMDKHEQEHTQNDTAECIIVTRYEQLKSSGLDEETENIEQDDQCFVAEADNTDKSVVSNQTNSRQTSQVEREHVQPKERMILDGLVRITDVETEELKLCGNTGTENYSLVNDINIETDQTTVDESTEHGNDDSMDVFDKTASSPVLNHKVRKTSTASIPLYKQVILSNIEKQANPSYLPQGICENSRSPCSDISLFADDSASVHLDNPLQMFSDSTPTLSSDSLTRNRFHNTLVDKTSSFLHTSKVSTPVMSDSHRHCTNSLDECVIFDSQELSPLVAHETLPNDNDCYGDSGRKVTFDPRLQKVSSVQMMDLKMKMCSPLKQQLFVPKSCLKIGSTSSENSPARVNKPCPSMAEEMSENHVSQPNEPTGAVNDGDVDVYCSQDLFEASVTDGNEHFVFENIRSASSSSDTGNKLHISVVVKPTIYSDNSGTDLFDDSFEDLILHSTSINPEQSHSTPNCTDYIAPSHSKLVEESTTLSSKPLYGGQRLQSHVLKPLMMNSPDILRTVLKYQSRCREQSSGTRTRCGDKENTCADESLDLFVDS